MFVCKKCGRSLYLSELNDDMECKYCGGKTRPKRLDEEPASNVPQGGNVNTLLCDVAAEMENAISKFPPFNSLHEGYAVILEELDELWDHVKVNQKNREGDKIRKECIQIAAMALRAIIDCEKDGFKK